MNLVVEQLRVQKEEMGYRMISDFWLQFTIAEECGYKAVQDTYMKLFRDWRQDYKYLTELVLVLHEKALHFQSRNELVSDLYITLYEVADNYAIDNLRGYELQYFFEING